MMSNGGTYVHALLTRCAVPNGNVDTSNAAPKAAEDVRIKEQQAGLTNFDKKNKQVAFWLII